LIRWFKLTSWWFWWRLWWWFYQWYLFCDRGSFNSRLKHLENQNKSVMLQQRLYYALMLVGTLF